MRSGVRVGTPFMHLESFDRAASGTADAPRCARSALDDMIEVRAAPTAEPGRWQALIDTVPKRWAQPQGWPCMRAQDA